MVSRTAAFDEAADARAGAMQASLLQSLIASGVDPVMARILGLYGFVDAANADDKRGGDVLIEAELPFFEPANLEAIDGRLHALLPEQDKEFFRNAAKSLNDRRLLRAGPGPGHRQAAARAEARGAQRPRSAPPPCPRKPAIRCPDLRPDAAPR